jgi:oligopeptide/dipeptide ABC transporter ATP-binding protein
MLEACVTDETRRALLEINEVRKYYPVAGRSGSNMSGWVRAVDGVSLNVEEHESVAIVGETGCGKTTTAKLALRLETPTSGSLHFRGKNIAKLRGPELRAYRRSVQAVFQDPWSSLDPRMRAHDIVAEPLVVNDRVSSKTVRERVAEQLMAVGLDPKSAKNFPHEFSGGQRQRVAIARALILQPDLIVLDEPVSSLDVSIGAQVMNLLKDLQEKLGAAYLLIAHNLATVRYLSNRVAVMYLGLIVETAPASQLFNKPLHPYTQALLSAALPTHRVNRKFDIVLTGDPPSASNIPPGCRFHPRCPFAFERCSKEVPEFRELAPGHWAACHLY